MVSQKWQTHQNKLQREHEKTMAVLKVLSEDEEMKYFLGALGGFGISTVSEFLEGKGLIAASDDDSGGGGGDSSVLGFIFPGGDLLDGVLGNSGKSISAFCISILILKAIFGDSGLNSLL